MNTENKNDKFSQLHIDVARNATDDFNLFHDPNKWQHINCNPFNGPIVLGFQLISLIERKIWLYRKAHEECSLISKNKLNFSNYQFSFANAVKPGQSVSVSVKKTQIKTKPDLVLSNRVSIKADGKLAIMGFKKESKAPIFLTDVDISEFKNLRDKPDRSYLESGYFIKRKFMNTSNAKNFLCGSLSDQATYFDELQDKVSFPEIFPCGLISCALLEKAIKNNHDFKKNPMVYATHKISIDRTLLAQLKSNDALHILVKQKISEKQLQDEARDEQCYECFAVFKENKVLFRALISLLPLNVIIESLSVKKS